MIVILDLKVIQDNCIPKLVIILSKEEKKRKKKELPDFYNHTNPSLDDLGPLLYVRLVERTILGKSCLMWLAQNMETPHVG